MLYLIDGSNLLGSQGKLGVEGSELALLAKIDRFCIVHGHNALVVFDGMDTRDAGSHFAFGRKTEAKIPYQKHGSHRADRLLMAEVKRLKSKRSPIVVTDDRDLALKVTDHGTPVLRSREFTRLLLQPVRERDPAASEKELAAQGIDNAELLEIWSADRPGEDEEE